jgi:hypothetical protein
LTKFEIERRDTDDRMVVEATELVAQSGFWHFSDTAGRRITLLPTASVAAIYGQRPFRADVPRCRRELRRRRDYQRAD